MQKLETTNYKPKTKRGFTLLIAVLVSGVLLSIGLAISSITIKEVLLSSSGRDSQFAFYAADSGAECALYWDRKVGSFSAATTESLISCNGTPITIPPLEEGISSVTTIFEFEVDGFCSKVAVTKSETHPRTKIESRGYNTACDDFESSRRIERAIRVTY